MNEKHDDESVKQSVIIPEANDKVRLKRNAYEPDEEFKLDGSKMGQI